MKIKGPEEYKELVSRIADEANRQVREAERQSPPPPPNRVTYAGIPMGLALIPLYLIVIAFVVVILSIMGVL